MLKNYLKIAWRNLWKNKIFSLINIAGLAIGLACCLFILLWVANEWSYDRYHAKLPRIYSVMENQHYSGGEIFTTSATPGPLGPVLKAEIPEIQQAAVLSWMIESLFTVGEKRFKEEGFYANNDIFAVFSIPFLEGDSASALKDPSGIVITEDLARKYFGTPRAVGKTIRLNYADNEKDKDYMVQGVVENIPDHSTIRFDYLLPLENLIKAEPWLEEWDNNSPRTYVLLREGSDETLVNGKIKNLIRKHYPETTTELFLYPFSKQYLYGTFKDGKPAGGRIDYVRLFIIVAVCVLLIACINFMNLSTARSSLRGKEVGVRKSIGAGKSSLITQFIGEAFIITSLAILLASLLVWVLLPVFEGFTNTTIHLRYINLYTLLVLAGLTLLTGFIAGMYPAFYLSSFDPVATLKSGSLKTKAGALFLRKGLVVFQFVISIVLITSALMVYQQITYIKNKNLGIEKENIVFIYKEGALMSNYESFRQALLGKPGIASVTEASQRPLMVGNSTNYVKWPGKATEELILFDRLDVGYDFEKTMGATIKEGRAFSRYFGADTGAFILNETAVQKMRLKDPVGKMISIGDSPEDRRPVLGVVKDFHTASMHDPIHPLIMRLVPEKPFFVLIRTKPGEATQALGSLENVYQQFNPAYPFSYHFLDQDYEDMYRSEQIIGRLSAAFTVLAISIACLGLFGLATFTAAQRTKEIGIRKALGASVASVVALLSKDFIKLVLIAILIAVPLAWFVMNRWLEDFAYRIDIEWWMFALAGLLAVVIALLTVSFQSVKAALMNPVKSLRSE